MTGIYGGLVAPGGEAGIVNPLTGMDINTSVGAPAIGSVTFNTTGTITGTGYSGPTNYYSPTTVGIGSNYWIRFTLDFGDAWDAGLVSGALNQLSSARSLLWTSGLFVVKQGSVTVQIYSDAGGTTLVTSGTLTFFVEGL